MDNQISLPAYPSGEIRTAAEDFARLMMMFQNRGALDGARILSEDSVNLMLTPSGYRNVDGWNQSLGLNGPLDLRGGQLWGHDGQDVWDSSAFYFTPDTHVGAIAFANGNYRDYSMNYTLLDLDLHLMSWFENSN